jgi:Pup-ligase protein
VAERLMGIETEYAITPMSLPSIGLSREALLNKLMEMARTKLVHLPDLGVGMYLGNGSRFYIDYGNHPELGTPECANPWDVVRYILAGERILAKLTSEIERRLPGVRVMIFKSNVDYGGTFATWGCHESYMHRADPFSLSDKIIPHLVSRIIYTGAGGFNSLLSGLEFTLSPRVPHLMNVVSNNSTSDRGIFHTKDESLSKPGFHRLHVICGESLCSERSMWLKVGTTALVVAMAEAGLITGHGVALRSPLQAMQTIANDPSCEASVETVDAKRLSAIEIQYHYLSLAERHLDIARMPPWAEDVCREWRAALNLLLDAPESVAATLDWAIKRAIYSNYASGKGVEWDSLHHWTPVLTDLRFAHDIIDNHRARFTADYILDRQGPLRHTVQALTPAVREKGLSWDSLDAVLALRKDLLEIDMRFGELGGRGIFANLDAAGVLTHHIAGVEAIEDAMIHPPAMGRARVRGEVIRRLGGYGYYKCDWQGVADLRSKRLLDLSDPFETEERWVDMTQVEALGTYTFFDFARLALGADSSV